MLLLTVLLLAPPVQPGDLVFHTSRSAQSQAVQLATGSRYSHMGVVLMRDGAPHVLEAGATVRYTPLAKWIRQGDPKSFVVRRLKQGLTPAQIEAIEAAAKPLLGKPYDRAFGWSDERIYCSELVWKLFQRALGVEIGARQRLRAMKLDHPAVKARLRERYGDAVPLDEPVVTPAAMFDSPALTTPQREGSEQKKP